MAKHKEFLAKYKELILMEKEFSEFIAKQKEDNANK